MTTPAWLERLENDDILLIDGGTGTELERRGVPGDEATWSGKGMHTHHDVVREIHEDYIRAGAEVIITNTFGTTRQTLEGAGLGDEVGPINRRAVEVALEARDRVGDRTVAVAGSISAMPPHFDFKAYGNRDEELETYRELAGILQSAGVELLALEMMEDLDHAPLAIEAAMETGLPVWLGVSCKVHRESGAIVSFGGECIPFGRLLDKLLEHRPAVVNIMHSEIDAIPEALDILAERWDGPVGVYPESGYFTKPDWNFVDVISPESLVDEARGWVAAGTRLLGGCCGTSPEHIRALQAARDELCALRQS